MVRVANANLLPITMSDAEDSYSGVVSWMRRSADNTQDGQHADLRVKSFDIPLVEP